jgi:multidrug efflux pump subunit AcrA (membrane-fusion protein)
MSRPASFAFAFLTTTLILTGCGQPPLPPRGPAAQEPADDPSEPPRPIDFERFQAMSPATRLRAVEEMPAVKAAFQPVARRDLTANVIERGSLDAANAADLSCQLKARGKDGVAATIKWVIDDGSMVKKGDKLIELDDAGLRDDIKAGQARADAAGAAATGAGDEMRRAKRAGDIAVRLAEIEVELAEADLKEPPVGQSKRVLELKVERARIRVEQAKDEAQVRLTRAEATQRERAAAAAQEVQRVRELEGQRANCVMTASMDGLAVYYVPEVIRFGSLPAVIAAGEPVREGQKLLRVVDLRRMVVNTRIHEAQVSSLRIGQPVAVRVDAFPNQGFKGKVAHVAAVASQDNWTRTDVKVYPVTIALDDNSLGLKPGMSSEVRIAIAERKGVLVVPARAVFGAGRGRHCFVKTGKELVEHEVVTGASDGKDVEVTAGLQEGDIILADPFAVISRPEVRKGGGKGPPR